MAVPSITDLKMWVGTLFTKDDWDFNVLAQARITVGHEIGHGIIDYLIENINEDNEAWGEFYTDFCNGEYGDEEDLVEEFGESLF
jgi:hypothetical protein